jgi:hypothetical protein
MIILLWTIRYLRNCNTDINNFIIFKYFTLEIPVTLKLREIVFQDGWGYDFRRNLSVAWKDYGRYATDLFTDEAVSVIDNHGKNSVSNNSTDPLFLYLAHLAVHSAKYVYVMWYHLSSYWENFVWDHIEYYMINWFFIHKLHLVNILLFKHPLK